MSSRVQASKYQKRLRTPRVSSLFFKSDLIFKALMKSIFLFIQGFFITKDFSNISAFISESVFLFIQSFFITPLSNVADLFRIVIFKKKAFKEFYPKILYLFSNIGLITGVFL